MVLDNIRVRTRIYGSLCNLRYSSFFYCNGLAMLNSQLREMQTTLINHHCAPIQ